MSNQLTAERRDETRQARERNNNTASKEQRGREAGGQFFSNPAMQLQASVGNRAMLHLLQQGDLGSKGSAKSSGAKLPNDVREKMETAFGTDFSDVTIHESPRAAAMGARAFAQKNRIHFAPGQYSPNSQKGQSLLGHELTHVVQQRQGRVDRSQGVVFNPALEQEADHFGERASRGMPVAGSLAMQMGPSPAPQLDSSAPIQGSFFGSIGRFAKMAAGGAMKLGKAFIDSGGMDMAKGALSGFMGAKGGGIGAGLSGALEGAGGVGGLLSFGKSMLGSLFGGGKKPEEEQQ